MEDEERDRVGVREEKKRLGLDWVLFGGEGGSWRDTRKISSRAGERDMSQKGDDGGRTD